MGSLIGCVYQKHVDPLLIPKTDIVDSEIKRDTVVIRDTFIVKSKPIVPTRERVHQELSSCPFDTADECVRCSPRVLRGNGSGTTRVYERPGADLGEYPAIGIPCLSGVERDNGVCQLSYRGYRSS